MKNIILCDLDGTLANVDHRLPLIFPPAGQPKNWDAFHAACVHDAPYMDVIEIVTTLRSANCGCAGSANKVYILSGRNDSVRRETEEWLDNVAEAAINFTYDGLIMRKADDRRPDYIIKLEMAQAHGFTPDKVLCVLDDRQSVVDMWRANGYRCLQVAAWKE